jgi:hypothetical protein
VSGKPAKLVHFASMLLLAAGCAPHRAAIDGPARGEGPGYLWPDDAAEPMPSSYAAGEAYGVSGSGYGVARRTIHEPEAPYTPPVPYLAPATPPPSASVNVSGDVCLKELTRAGIRFRELSQLRGVAAPVEVRGKLGGVDYWTDGGSPLRMDCRLALTLAKVGAVLARHGVTRVRYSGAYVYKTAPSGRLSHHAHGLAIDLHEFSRGQTSLSVDRAFSRNVGCKGDVPALNRLACELRATRSFEEFLTPDYNAAHRDHLHLSVPRR